MKQSTRAKLEQPPPMSKKRTHGHVMTTKMTLLCKEKEKKKSRA